PFFIILVAVSVVAGAYPVLYISNIKSLHLMKKDQAASGGRTVRNTLVTTQFAITTGLVICTLMVYLQLQYLKNKEMGFDQSVIINMPIHNDEAVIPKIPSFRNEVTAHPGINNVTASSHEMFSDYTYITNFSVEEIEDEYRWERYTVEQEYIATFDLELITGRGFDGSIPSDSNAFILNESAVKALGLTPDEAINRNITDLNLEKTGKIVGVVKDFHYRSLHHNIQPFVLYVNWDRLDYISVRLQSENFTENIAHLEEGWYQTFGESVPFFYNFLDDQAADLYEREGNESQLFTLFSAVSIAIGALGLFGFALFTTEKRFKEIGLRKVLGATTWQLILLINQNFMKILIIAFVLATPIAFYLMRNWLSEFAYRIEQPIWVYIVTPLMTLLIATLTVSFLSWKAASANPVDSIKVE
ncbi:MAG: FtsX-like permease family protein, partial [Bacteroidota bacterium]